jgi:cyclophilin family peptidyl-prolyl cis-trans isomerase
LGDLNIELHCDIAPRTTENFIYLCEMGYYNDTVFHRSIKNFMIQVGGKFTVLYLLRGGKLTVRRKIHGVSCINS